jgi:uncharacterized protein (DUF952 family)
VILHVATQSDWDNQLNSADFAPESLRVEGFIHCCTPEQLPGVLQRYYSNRTDLLLLELDETSLTATMKFESATGGELFPHLFGRINKNAIRKISALKA